VAAALAWVRGFTSTSEALNRLDPAAAACATGRLREALAAHTGDDGVWFNSRAWIVTARRRLAFVRRGWLIPRMRPKGHANSPMSHSV
jgi:hypothetical protein